MSETRNDVTGPPPIVPAGWASERPPARLPDIPRTRIRAAVASMVVAWLARRGPVQIVDASRQPHREVSSDVPTLKLHRPEVFYRRLAAAGLIGFGESYQAGEWDSDDLSGLLTVLAEYADAHVPSALRRVRWIHDTRRPHGEDNTVVGTRRNIHRHYDLSNEMFHLFLDETMTYSCALFDIDQTGRPVASEVVLAEAQVRKIDRLLDAVGTRRGTRLLEIGTGWGELAIRAARRGAKVHTVTLSAEQHVWVRRRAAQAGLAHLIDVEIRDYREIDLAAGDAGYDAIVSVEMIEAVGERYWATYFATLDRLLALEQACRLGWGGL